MHYPRLLAALRAAKWSIQPAAIHAIYDSLGAHLRGSLGTPRHATRALSPEVVSSIIRTAALPEPPPAPPPPALSPVASPPPPASPVAVVEVYGILGKHLSSLETMCGGCDVDCVAAEIATALADPAVQCLVLDFDSPGGVVTGIPELAQKIRELRARTGKPVYAHTESLCASAAYWLASACEQIFCTPTADLGSIGVYVALVDDSEWWKKEGFKLELIKAGEFKATGISGQPLSEAARALLQAEVDAVYAMFTADVRRGRGPVADEVMQGQTFMGEAAVAAGLADEIVPDLATLIAGLEAELRAPAPSLI